MKYAAIIWHHSEDHENTSTMIEIRKFGNQENKTCNEMRNEKRKTKMQDNYEKCKKDHT